MPQDLSIEISEQSKASAHRLEEARALLQAGRWRGAMYMAGYAVECLRKAKLMQRDGCRTLRELEAALPRRGVLAEQATMLTPHLEVLLRFIQRLDHRRQPRMLWPQCVLVNRWIPAWRYTADAGNRQDATDFLEAVLQIMRWLEHNV